MNARLHNVPISERPPSTWSRKLLAVIFVVTFDALLIITNAFQFIFLLPLRLAPFAWSRNLYKTSIRLVKGFFACILSMSTRSVPRSSDILVSMTQCFAPSKFVITFETQGKGAFTRDELDRIVVRDESGQVASLNFSTTKFVLIANHQVSLSASACPNANFSLRYMPIGGMYGVFCIIWGHMELIEMSTSLSRSGSSGFLLLVG